jgi:hypothetical protein
MNNKWSAIVEGLKYNLYRYPKYKVRYFIYFSVPWSIAKLLPKRVVLVCFVMVTANTKEGIIDGYEEAYEEWCKDKNITDGFW